MGFEKGPQKPPEVIEAQKVGDTEKLRALGRAGGIASSDRREVERIKDDLVREMHEEGMQQAAEARRDDLLPSED